MWLSWMGRFHVIEITQRSEDGNILGSLRGRARFADEVVREPQVEIVALFNLGDVLGRELQA